VIGARGVLRAGLALAVALALAACGDDDGASGGGGGGGGAGGGGAIDGGSCEPGERCACGPDGALCPAEDCIELAEGGLRACRTEVEEQTSCSGPGDACCSTAECDEGLCVEGPVTPYCGGIVPAGRNVCAADLCTSDEACPEGQVCLPAGVYGRPVRTCVQASCTSDADCDAAPGGTCLPFRSPCCSAITAIACHYPSGCASDADCPGGRCEVQDGALVCVEGSRFCPL
jgi:hypothetical protein